MVGYKENNTTLKKRKNSLFFVIFEYVMYIPFL